MCLHNKNTEAANGCYKSKKEPRTSFIEADLFEIRNHHILSKSYLPAFLYSVKKIECVDLFWKRCINYPNIHQTYSDLITAIIFDFSVKDGIVQFNDSENPGQLHVCIYF